MRPRLGHALVLGALVCALAAGALAQVDSSVDPESDSGSDSKARIVRLSFVQGDVRMERPDSGGLDTAFLNMPIVEGSRAVTGNDGFAELEFESGGTVRLTPGSELRVRELGLRGGHQVSMLELGDGTVYFNVKKDSDDDFRVVVNGQEVRVAKSSRFRIRAGRGNAEIAVTKGELELVGSEHAVRIKKDETITLDAQDASRYFLARNVTAFSYDAWDRERDEYRERYVATANSYRGYSSGYSYGVSDLNYYGSYINMAGYGYVWRPYGYDASWDPFSDGAWVWYPGYGYTWVSGYAWGWMPYRYGRWVYISGYGWVWQPGNSWHRWRTCTTVYHPGHRYRRPEPPIRAGGGGGRRGGGSPGSGGGKVVVVGKGPFSGRGPGTKEGGGRGRVLADIVDAAPAVMTPGLRPNGAVVEELRRVHGQDLGLPVRGRRPQPSDDAAASTATTPTGSTASTGVGTTSEKPVQQVVTPARPGRGARDNDADGAATNPAAGSAAGTSTTTTTTPTVTTPARPVVVTPQAPTQTQTVSTPASTYRGSSSSGGSSSGSSGSSSGSSSPRSSSSSSPSSSASSSGRSSGGSSSAPASAPSRSSSSSRSSSNKDPK